MVVVGDQGANAGKNYWVDVETTDALSPPAVDEARTQRKHSDQGSRNMRQAGESASSVDGSRTTLFAEYNTLDNFEHHPLPLIRPELRTWSQSARERIGYFVQISTIRCLAASFSIFHLGCCLFSLDFCE